MQPHLSSRETLRGRLLLALAVITGLALRIGTWSRVFTGGQTWLDGPDAYYHLRRAWLTLQDWPITPQTDMMIGAPEGGPISWPPVFDLLLATIALPWRVGMSPESFERLGASLPTMLGVVEIVAVYVLARRLFGRVAGGWAACVAAALPGVVRFSLLGALDHDPLVESLALVALFGLAGAACDGSSRRSDVAWFGAGASFLVLTWAGSVLHIGLFACLALVLEGSALFGRVSSTGEGSRLGPTLGAGSLLAAGVTMPFVIGSVWTERFGATFIGLSWLHQAMLFGLATLGWSIAVRSRRTRVRVVLLAVSTLGLLLLLGMAWPAFRAGLVFFTRGEAFLQGVMESQPLLFLFGTLDFTASIIRLSPLLLLAPVLAPWTLWRARGDRRLVLLWVWLFYMLVLALVQARYAHGVALPTAVLAGVLISNFKEIFPVRWKTSAAVSTLVLVTLSALPAYVGLPGLESYRLFDRVPKILSTGLFEACDFLREHAGSSESWTNSEAPASWSVIAPWTAGHWLIWRGRQAVVTTPLGPQGQPAFADGVRFYLETDEVAVERLIERRRIRYFVAVARIPPLEAYTQLVGAPHGVFFAGDPGSRVLDAEKYLASVAARLTWIGPQEIELFGKRLPPLDRFREIYRSDRTRSNPFAPALTGAVPNNVPMVRVFEFR